MGDWGEWKVEETDSGGGGEGRWGGRGGGITKRKGNETRKGERNRKTEKRNQIEPKHKTNKEQQKEVKVIESSSSQVRRERESVCVDEAHTARENVCAACPQMTVRTCTTDIE